MSLISSSISGVRRAYAGEWVIVALAESPAIFCSDGAALFTGYSSRVASTTVTVVRRLNDSPTWS